MSSTSFISPNEIRTKFTQAMSEMYQLEVPLYKKLLQLVDNVNESTEDSKTIRNETQQLNQEHHGAIRLGTAAELSMMRRLFAVMDMHPVDYYDLSVAGIPVHSTAFRALSRDDLEKSPFRVFCSLLRLDLIEDDLLAEQANILLSKREIIPEKLLKLIQLSEKQGGLKGDQANSFNNYSLEVFRWHHNSTLDKRTYEALKSEHALIADVVSFRGPHINHLTPKVLDIDECQSQFDKNQIKAKAFVEGPPVRKCPILLRQTSFIAIAEKVIFSKEETGEHTARFGEVEQRGMALTPKGRSLYDQLLLNAKNGDIEIDYNIRLKEAFKAFPDNYDEIRQQELGYFHYSITNTAKFINTIDIESLITKGVIKVSPIIYEDFLPVSAAGIFTSNLSTETSNEEKQKSPDRAKYPHLNDFEKALGTKVKNSFNLYENTQTQSLQKTLDSLFLHT